MNPAESLQCRNKIARQVARSAQGISRCLRPGSGAFFKEKCLFAIFLATMMKLKRNLAHGPISLPLTFLSDTGVSYNCDAFSWK